MNISHLPELAFMSASAIVFLKRRILTQLRDINKLSSISKPGLEHFLWGVMLLISSVFIIKTLPQESPNLLPLIENLFSCLFSTESDPVVVTDLSCALFIFSGTASIAQT